MLDSLLFSMRSLRSEASLFYHHLLSSYLVRMAILGFLYAAFQDWLMSCSDATTMLVKHGVFRSSDSGFCFLGIREVGSKESLNRLLGRRNILRYGILKPLADSPVGFPISFSTITRD